MVGQNFIEIKPHSRRKYTILRKYLGACEKLSNKYQNFAYIDTHGGTGEVIDLKAGKTIDGSVRIAAKIKPSFPCYVVEIDPDNYALLEKSIKDFPNVHLFQGDCNEKIDEILKMIPRGEKFVFCFLDPNGLVYRRGNFLCSQLTWETIHKIANFPRTEILQNFVVEAIMRDAGYIRNYPNEPASLKMEENITTLFGSEKWKRLEPGDYKGFVRLYIAERLEGHYEYKGAILIRDVERKGPLYYLVYASKYWLGGKIMRDVMKKEWGYEPLFPLDQTHPPNLFIFED